MHEFSRHKNPNISFAVVFPLPSAAVFEERTGAKCSVACYSFRSLQQKKYSLAVRQLIYCHSNKSIENFPSMTFTSK